MSEQKEISYLREPQVQVLTKLSKSTRWRLEKEGLFPKKRRLSRRSVGWLASEIQDWMQSRSEVGSHD